MAEIPLAPIELSYPEAGGKIQATMASRRMVADVRFRQMAKTPMAPLRPYIPSPFVQIAEAGTIIGNNAAKLLERMQGQKTNSSVINSKLNAENQADMEDLKQSREFISATNQLGHEEPPRD